MKFFIVASIMMSAFSSASFAGEICGTLGSHTVGPKCAAGQACPMWLKLQYDLTTADGSQYDLETADAAVLSNFTQLSGGSVCVDGSETQGSFEVSAIAKN